MSLWLVMSGGQGESVSLWLMMSEGQGGSVSLWLVMSGGHGECGKLMSQQNRMERCTERKSPLQYRFASFLKRIVPLHSRAMER